MRRWLNADNQRKIRPEAHTSGWRVSLFQGHYDVCSSVADTIEAAFADAEHNFDTRLLSKLQEELTNMCELQARSAVDMDVRIERMKEALDRATAKLKGSATCSASNP
jgi:hypothetical protein